MSSTSAAGDRSNRSRKWWILAAALLLVGTGGLLMGLRGNQHPLAGPVGSHVPRPASVGDAATVPSKVAPAVTVRSAPVELRIPAIALTVSLSTLGLNPDGTVQVPTDIQQPGWFRLGPSPGHQGSAVFFNLRSLVAGDQVDITLVDGVTAQFKVTSVAMYLKQSFPDQQVYGSHGYSALQLVTCGGVFDSDTGHYLSNIVVYTSLVATTPATAAADGSLQHS